MIPATGSQHESDRVGRCPDGSAQLPAFADLYRLHHGAVYRSCLRSVRDHHQAEDAVQETFLRAHRALDRFEGTSGLRGWLLRIAHNVCVDIARKQGRRPQLVGLDRETRVDPHPSPEEVWVAEGLEVGGAWQRISPEHRAALHLRHVQGLSYLEISGALGRSPAQTKALLHRALRALRSAWAHAQTVAATAA